MTLGRRQDIGADENGDALELFAGQKDGAGGYDTPQCYCEVDQFTNTFFVQIPNWQAPAPFDLNVATNDFTGSIGDNSACNTAEGSVIASSIGNSPPGSSVPNTTFIASIVT